MQKTIQKSAKKGQKCTKTRAEKCRIMSNNHQKHIKFGVHPVVFILLFASIFLGLFWLFFVYFASIILHEFSHAIVAKKLGYKTNKIVLYPTGCLLFGETDEFTFKDEILISLAGPLFNLIITIFLVCLWWIIPETYNFSQDVAIANLSLALFNLLPVFPLDGGRVLLALLSSKFERKFACKIARIIAIIFSILLFIYFAISLFFAPNFQVAIMSIILFISAITEDQELAIKRVIKSDIKNKKLLRGLKKVWLVFSDQATLKNVHDKIDNFAVYEIIIIDSNFNQIARFSEFQIENLCLSFNLHTQLKNII